MNEAKDMGKKTWLSAIGVLVGVFGMLWLASAITAQPEETVRLAGKYGWLIWLPSVVVWLGMYWEKKRIQRRRSSDGLATRK